MNSVWPKPERLIPPKLLQALAAAHSGETETAQAHLEAAGTDDALTAEVGRLVRGLVALEKGAATRGRQLLRPLVRHEDAAISLAATFALSELHAADRRYTTAIALLRRARQRTHDDATLVALDAQLMRLELLRRGDLDAAKLEELPAKLKRRHHAAVHAAVHLLRSEGALARGDLRGAISAVREAQPYVTSSQQARLVRQQSALIELLDEAPFAEVEDWLRPKRPVTRGQVADLQNEPWQLWLDFMHRKLSYRRTPSGSVLVVHFSRSPGTWQTLAALAASPRQRLTWSRARAVLRVRTEAMAQERFTELQAQLAEHDTQSIVEIGSNGCRMKDVRFVFMDLTQQLPETQKLLLGLLAETPGAQANELHRQSGISKRTLVRHLGQLRQRGFVRLVGGGREARYQLV